MTLQALLSVELGGAALTFLLFQMVNVRCTVKPFVTPRMVLLTLLTWPFALWILLLMLYMVRSHNRVVALAAINSYRRALALHPLEEEGVSIDEHYAQEHPGFDLDAPLTVADLHQLAGTYQGAADMIVAMPDGTTRRQMQESVGRYFVARQSTNNARAS